MHVKISLSRDSFIQARSTCCVADVLFYGIAPRSRAEARVGPRNRKLPFGSISFRETQLAAMKPKSMTIPHRLAGALGESAGGLSEDAEPVNESPLWNILFQSSN